MPLAPRHKHASALTLVFGAQLLRSVENRDWHKHLNQIPVIDFNIGPWPPRMWGWGYTRVKWTR